MLRRPRALLLVLAAACAASELGEPPPEEDDSEPLATAPYAPFTLRQLLGGSGGISEADSHVLAPQ